jgi:solute carrier family 25 folate transporter 32
MRRYLVQLISCVALFELFVINFAMSGDSGEAYPNFLRKFSQSLSQVQKHLIAGVAAGMVSTTATFPLDLVKVRYQVHDQAGNAYRSLFSAVHTIVRKESFMGLYKGLGTAMLASSVSWGGYFYFYENIKELKLASMATSSQSSASGTSKLGPFDHLVAGTQAGVVMVFLTNPIWLIKTRLQLQGSRPEAPQYRGFLHAVSRISREEGVTALYKGLVPALILTTHGAVQFMAYEYMKDLSLQMRIAQLPQGVDQRAYGAQLEQPGWVSFVTGGASKIVATLATYPYQVVKSRLQQQGANSLKYDSTMASLRLMWANEGLRGFFRGVVPNCLKVAPSAALTFLVYEEMMKQLTDKPPGIRV